MKKHIFNILIIFSAFGLFAQTKLDVQTCRKKALEYNQDVKSAKAIIGAATEMTKSAKTAYFPKLDLSGSYMYDQNVGEINAPGTPVYDNSGTQIGSTADNIIPLTQQGIHIVSLDLSQPIYAGGQIKQWQNMTLIQEKIANKNLDKTNADVILLTDLRYWNTVSLKEKIKLAEQYKVVVSEFVTVVQNKFDAEIANRNDLLLAKVKLNEAELLLLKTQNAFVISKMALNNIIGNEINTEIDVVDSIFGNLSGPIGNNIQNKAINQRPEISMLIHNVEAKETAIKLIQSEFMPKVYLGLSAYNRSSYFEGGDYVTSFQGIVGLKVPIFYWNDKKYKTNSKKFEKDRAEMQLDKMKDNVALEVQAAFYSLAESVTKIKLTNSSYEQASENLRLTKENYFEGVAPMLLVLEAQTSWQKAYSEYIDAKAEYKVNESKYLKATGEIK